MSGTPVRSEIGRLLLLSLLAGLIAGCGGERRDASEPGEPSSAELREQLAQATSSSASEFPAVKGRTMQEVANGLDGTGPEVGLATTVFVPGRNRLAFGLIDSKTGFVYGKTAVYVGHANGRAYGPYPAPADLLITDGRYRSRTAASPRADWVGPSAGSLRSGDQHGGDQRGPRGGRRMSQAR